MKKSTFVTRTVGGAVALAAIAILPRGLSAADWAEVQKLKAGYLKTAAQHAMEQQKTANTSSISIPWPAPASQFLAGNVKLTNTEADALTLDLTAAAKRYNAAPTESLRINLAKPLDLTKHSGLTLTVKSAEGTSPEVRLGARLIASSGKIATIDPCVPVLNAFGSNPHEIYLDWAFLNYANVDDALAVLKDVSTIELTFASALRAPERGGSKAPQPAKLTLSNLSAVDYLKGSYDPSRQWIEFDAKAGKFVPGNKRDLTLMHRTQEVTGIVALFGGEPGITSAIDSLDMCARTQCWDGSFLDGRRGAVTVASGEYTFGFTIYGTLCAYQALEKAKHPALDEKITVGPDTMTRREFYQRMFYRAAMARTAATPSEYRDDIIGGDTLMAGANRVLGYAIGMRMVADVLTDPAKKKEVLEKYEPIMTQIADAQGKYSGGFPVLGEGDMYGGKGIHYDAGYTRTHMDWLVAGAVRTGDPRIIKMLERYQQVFDATMDENGDGIVPLLSERHPGTESVSLIVPDATAQVGMKYKLPIIAQWGYNSGMPVWKNWEKKQGNHFTYAARVRGYPLGAHMQVLVDDMAAEPEPKDLGYLFPRQYPIWSSTLMTKDGKVARVSKMYIKPDGSRVSDFVVKVGEFPKTVGVPVLVKSDQTFSAVAEELSGWPKLLPAGAGLKIVFTDSGRIADRNPPLELTAKVGEKMGLVPLEGPATVVVTGPEMSLPAEAGGGKVPFRAKFTLTPEKPGQKVEMTVLAGTVAQSIKFVPPQVIAGLPAGANVASAENGGTVADLNHRAPQTVLKALDDDLKNFCVIEDLASASFKLQFAGAFPLDKVVIYPGQYGKPELKNFPRPKDITITVPGREPIAATLEDKPFEPQEVSLGGASADNVKITVRSVYPASKPEVDWGGFAEIKVLKK